MSFSPSFSSSFWYQQWIFLFSTDMQHSKVVYLPSTQGYTVRVMLFLNISLSILNSPLVWKSWRTNDLILIALIFAHPHSHSSFSFLFFVHINKNKPNEFYVFLHFCSLFLVLAFLLSLLVYTCHQFLNIICVQLFFCVTWLLLVLFSFSTHHPSIWIRNQ